MVDDTKDIDNDENKEEDSSEINVLSLSDEEIENMPVPGTETPEENKEQEEDSTDAGEEESEDDVADATEEEKEDTSEDETTEITDDTDDVASEDKKEEAPELVQEEIKAEETEDEGKEPDPDVNFEAEYNRILAPFRANGKDIQVSSVDDAITLMKMGANYNKKMAGLKPNLKLMKMLENNKLLDEKKISNLIDLDQKNPEAIIQLIKDSGIDIDDLDLEKTTEYKPGNTYNVDDKEVDLDLVLEDIQDTPTFDATIDIISNKWDDSSKKELLADPGLIKVINDHVANGIYEQIATVMASERMLGRLTELSDLDAYKFIGDSIQEKKGFKPKDQANTANDKKEPVKLKEKIVSKSKAKEDPKLKDRKKAAGSTNRASPKKGQPFDPLALSDEAFEKAAAKIAM